MTPPLFLTRNAKALPTTSMIVESEFREAWWLPGGHLQTLWPAAVNARPDIGTRDELLEMPDGDALTLSWLARDNAPIAVIFHGLEGSKHSHYAWRIMRRLFSDGFSVVLMHFRGCDGKPNRLARSYHSGDTGDIGYLLNRLRTRYRDAPIVCAGYSLGGNALLKYLAEQRTQAVPLAAVATSVPFELHTSANRLRSGLSRIYQRHLLSALRESVLSKRELLAAQGIDLENLHTYRDFRAFDDAITAPLHGFAGVDEYYSVSSSRQYLSRITTDTLIVQARNDPFTTPDVLPGAGELAECVTLELADGGGHVGFVAGTIPGRAVYWLDGRISDYLLSAVAETEGRFSPLPFGDV